MFDPTETRGAQRTHARFQGLKGRRYCREAKREDETGR
jgi:hypothetical protein